MSVILNKETTAVASSSLSTPIQERADAAQIPSALEAIKETAVRVVAAEEPKIVDVVLSSKKAKPEKCLSLLKEAVEKGVGFNKKHFFDQMRNKENSFLPVVDFFLKKCVDDINCLKNEEYETLLDDLCDDKPINDWLIRYLIEQRICVCPAEALTRACEKKEVEMVSILLNKSLKYAEKFVEDYHLKHAICTYNGISNSKVEEGNGARDGAKQIFFILKDLPKNIRKMIPEECFGVIEQAFKEACLNLEDEIVKGINKGNLVIIPAGSEDHEIYLVFALGYMFICNRGNPDSVKMVAGYKINKDNFSLEDLKKIFEISDTGTLEEAENYLYKVLPEELSAATCEFCAMVERILSPKKAQKIGNCSFTSAKLALRLATGLGLSSCKEDVKKLELAKEFSKAVSAHLRLRALDKYLEFHEVNKDLGLYDHDFAKEAISLAIKHLRSNPVIDLKDYPHCKKAFEANRPLAAAS
ncbi:MAG TPA: hypothetical protein VLG76_04975 [Rhabdochlamydiaceae bacterium]|nr:hypothetical protein [Rhabdochlamydiaceae bacterium]